MRQRLSLPSLCPLRRVLICLAFRGRTYAHAHAPAERSLVHGTDAAVVVEAVDRASGAMRRWELTEVRPAGRVARHPGRTCTLTNLTPAAGGRRRVAGRGPTPQFHRRLSKMQEFKEAPAAQAASDPFELPHVPASFHFVGKRRGRSATLPACAQRPNNLGRPPADLECVGCNLRRQCICVPVVAAIWTADRPNDGGLQRAGDCGGAPAPQGDPPSGRCRG